MLEGLKGVTAEPAEHQDQSWERQTNWVELRRVSVSSYPPANAQDPKDHIGEQVSGYIWVYLADVSQGT